MATSAVHGLLQDVIMGCKFQHIKPLSRPDRSSNRRVETPLSTSTESEEERNQRISDVGTKLRSGMNIAIRRSWQRTVLWLHVMNPPGKWCHSGSEVSATFTLCGWRRPSLLAYLLYGWDRRRLKEKKPEKPEFDDIPARAAALRFHSLQSRFQKVCWGAQSSRHRHSLRSSSLSVKAYMLSPSDRNHVTAFWWVTAMFYSIKCLLSKPSTASYYIRSPFGATVVSFCPFRLGTTVTF